MKRRNWLYSAVRGYAAFRAGRGEQAPSHITHGRLAIPWRGDTRQTRSTMAAPRGQVAFRRTLCIFGRECDSWRDPGTNGETWECASFLAAALAVLTAVKTFQVEMLPGKEVPGTVPGTGYPELAGPSLFRDEPNDAPGYCLRYTAPQINGYTLIYIHCAPLVIQRE